MEEVVVTLDWKIAAYIDENWANQSGVENAEPVSEIDPSDSNRVGLYGEAAFAQLFGLPFEITYKQGGDGGYDFIYRGYKVDVKTAMKGWAGKNVFYSHKPKSRHDIPLKADIYVSAYIVDNHYRNGRRMVNVAFVGYAMKDVVGQTPQEPTKDGKGMNHVVQWDRLTAFDSLQSIQYKPYTGPSAYLRANPIIIP